MQKRIPLLITAGLFALATPALGADLTPAAFSKAPPLVAAIYDWSGLYAGINGGAGWARANASWDEELQATSSDRFLKATGATYGGQIGYRWQRSHFVFGLEAQGNWTDFSGSAHAVAGGLLPSAQNALNQINSFALVTGQVGTAWNNVLVTVKGGAAVLRAKYDSDVSIWNTPVFSAAAKGYVWGGTAGLGLDYGFAPNWSLGLEWNHIFLSGRDVTVSGTCLGSPISITKPAGHQNFDIALLRLNYHFGGPRGGRY
ncbi:MAG: outer membrane beta-barrel protein [Alphaproteobacteria bacterium]|nr:outer membrane beta-barrel protein [Alphaproteobacteria bacterium]